MKIIQIIPNFSIGGAETMCENLTYDLIRLGHEVIIISLFDYHSPITERMEKFGANIIYLDKKSGIDISMIGKIRKILEKEKPDVVHSHRNDVQYSVPAALMAGVKKIVHTVHSVAKNENIRPIRKLNKAFFKFFGVVPVALSDAVADTIVDEYRIEKSDIPVILNGSDLSKCIPKENYKCESDFTIVHIGRFAEVKNHVGLIDAYKMFHDKHPDSELWLVGDGELKADIENYALNKGLAEKVKFWGMQDSVHEVLNKADMFVLSSHYEGVPMTIIEAMGTGLPIVSTAVGGVPDMLTDNVDALLTKVDSQERCAAMEKLYESEELRQRLGERAKTRSDLFSSSITAEKYVEVYKGV